MNENYILHCVIQCNKNKNTQRTRDDNSTRMCKKAKLYILQ